VRGLTFEDVWAMFLEAERRFQDTERMMKESSQETERMIAKLGEKTDKQFGEWGNRFGELAEHLITPNITEKFRSLNYTFTKADLNVKFTDAQGDFRTFLVFQCFYRV
jgi:predicted transcriptional regulator